ncbi:MAG: hypothetical protein KDA80_01955 [Planctomycetaceae bacterium]|nr:hypothetical protein [Planctomycetaceae bacterium]
MARTPPDFERSEVVDDAVCRRLAEVYRLLRGHFGYAKCWWPGSPWRVAITAMLVQQCDWTVADQAAGRLEQAGLFTIDELSQAEPSDIARTIQPVSFSPTKAERLIGFAATLKGWDFHTIETFLASADTKALRRSLLTVKGIGDETADCILLYSGNDHPCFVIDAYTRRFFSRVRLSSDHDERFWKRPSATLRESLERHILASLDLYAGFDFDESVERPVALLRDYHALLVEIGRHHCLKTRPRCWEEGKVGWKDYLFCQTHCVGNGCKACPLENVCHHADSIESPSR